MKIGTTQQSTLVQKYRKCIFTFGPSQKDNSRKQFLDSAWLEHVNIWLSYILINCVHGLGLLEINWWIILTIVTFPQVGGAMAHPMTNSLVLPISITMVSSLHNYEHAAQGCHRPCRKCVKYHHVYFILKVVW